MLGGFHDYAFVFGFDDEFVADFYAEFRADAFGYCDLVFSGHFYFFHCITVYGSTSVVLKNSPRNPHSTPERQRDEKPFRASILLVAGGGRGLIEAAVGESYIFGGAVLLFLGLMYVC